MGGGSYAHSCAPLIYIVCAAKAAALDSEKSLPTFTGGEAGTLIIVQLNTQNFTQFACSALKKR